MGWSAPGTSVPGFHMPPLCGWTDDNDPALSPTTRSRDPSSATESLCAAPAGCDSGGQHHFNHFCSDEPIQAQMCGLRKRVRENVQPAEPSCEQHGLGGDSCDDGAREAPGTVFEEISGNECDQGIHEQESASDSEHLCDSTRARRIKHRKARHALEKVHN